MNSRELTSRSSAKAFSWGGRLSHIRRLVWGRSATSIVVKLPNMPLRTLDFASTVFAEDLPRVGLGLTCVKANRDSRRPAIQKAQATDRKRKFLAIRVLDG